MPRVSPEVVFEESKARESLAAIYLLLHTKLQELEKTFTALKAIANKLEHIGTNSSLALNKEARDFLVSFATSQGFTSPKDFKCISQYFIIKSEPFMHSLKKLHSFMNAWTNEKKAEEGRTIVLSAAVIDGIPEEAPQVKVVSFTETQKQSIIEEWGYLSVNLSRGQTLELSASGWTIQWLATVITLPELAGRILMESVNDGRDVRVRFIGAKANFSQTVALLKNMLPQLREVNEDDESNIEDSGPNWRAYRSQAVGGLKPYSYHPLHPWIEPIHTQTESLEVLIQEFSSDVRSFVLAAQQQKQVSLQVASDSRLGRLIETFMQGEPIGVFRYDDWYIILNRQQESKYSIQYDSFGTPDIPEESYLRLAWLLALMEEEAEEQVE